LKSRAIRDFLKEVVDGKVEAIDKVCQEMDVYMKKLQEILACL
jgi:hypothetical protein